MPLTRRYSAAALPPAPVMVLPTQLRRPNIFRSSFLSGKDIFSSNETSGDAGDDEHVGSSSTRVQNNAPPKKVESRRRRRRPPPDGYLFDVATKRSDDNTNRNKEEGEERPKPSRIALNRGNHYQIDRDIACLTEEELLFDGLHLFCRI